MKVLGFLTRAVLPDGSDGRGDGGRVRGPGTESLLAQAYQMAVNERNPRYDAPLAIITSVDLIIANASSPRRSFSSSTASLVITAVSR